MEFKESPDQSKAATIAYIQLWAFCGRHFDVLTSHTPKKENGQDKPAVKGRNPIMWQRLAKFALSLGFRTPTAEQLAPNDSASQLAIDYLQKANPVVPNFNTQQIQAVLQASSCTSIQETQPVIPYLSEIEVERRCGRPFELDLECDKRTLFFLDMYRGFGKVTDGVNISFVRQCLFRCIFGEFEILVGSLGFLLNELIVV
jgi:hypothetical protein